MLTPDLRHKHSWLAWDWEKIKYSDLEWAPTSSWWSIKSWHFTITATGNIVITGLWFKPKHLRILSNISWWTWSIKSDWVTDWTNMHNTYDYNTTWWMRSYYVTTSLIYIEDWSSWTFQNMTWIITSFDIDWFTINITNKSLAWTGQCTYTAQ
jgi:hypothetical protein